MSPLGRLFGGLRSLLRKNHEDQELNEELRDYLDAAIERKMASGMNREDARRSARIELGSPELIKDDVRAVGWESIVETIWQDVRYGVRVLLRNPRFTAAATVTLALGIGATTAIFSVVSAVLWQPLAYPNAARMVNIVENVPAGESFNGRAMRISSMNPEEFRWWQTNLRTLSDMAVIAAESRKVVASEGAVTLEGAAVSPSLFAMRGVQPVLGRWLYPDEERPGTGVVVLSAETWRRYYGADRGIVNRTIALDGQPYTVVGVMPAEFGEQAFWTPYAAQSQPGMMQLLQAVFLLGDGVALEDAVAEVNELGTQLRGSAPEPGAPPRFEVVRQTDQAVANVRPAIRMLVVAVVVVLLIVCANVANLLMVRGASRYREIGIRQALGAARLRIIRQLVTEGLLLSLMGGVVGVVLAYAGVELLRAGSVIEIPAGFRFALGPLGTTILPRADQVAVDSSVLAFALAVSLTTGVVFALVPAWRLSRAHSRDAVAASQLTSRGGASGRGSSRTGNVLAVLQIALATTLLIGSGLLLRSFVNLSSVYTGFDPDAQIFHLVSPPEYSRSRKLELAYEFSTRLRSRPGVEAAGLINLPPLSPVSLFRNLYLPTSMESQRDSMEDADRATVRGVSSEYLQALGVRLMEGRWLQEQDGPGQPQVMLVNRAWAERFSPGQSPVGTTASFLTTGRVRRYVTWEIVGVVDNVRWRMDGQSGMQPDSAMPMLGFMDLRQLAAFGLAADTGQPNMELDELIGEPGASFAVRTSGRPLTVDDVRSVARDLDPRLGTDGMSTMGDVFSGIIGRQRFYAVIVGLFAGIAALIAAVGIYGVLAYAMTQRTQEFGIRMALGAPRRQVLGLVLRQGAVIAAIGIPAGIAGALALTRYLETMLFGIPPGDVKTYLAVVIVFAVVALFAAYIPARRATKVDPLIALRYE